MNDIYSLGRYVIFQELGDTRLIGVGSKQTVIESQFMWQCIINLSELARRRPTLQKLREYDENSSNPGTLQFLLDNNFIIKDTDLISTSRYNRSLYYYQSIGLSPEDVETSLKKSRVTILGCGGIGNHIGAALATNGIGTINLVDGDHIELSNLTRQILFDENDIDARKVDVLAKRLRERNSHCRIHTFDTHINTIDDLKEIPESDIIIVSADSSGIVNLVNIFCVENKKTFINVGYMNDIAIWGPFVIPGETGCYACGSLRIGLIGKDKNLNSNEDRLRKLNQDFKSATFPPINATASALATSDIIRYLAGSKSISSLNKRIGFHDLTLKLETQDFSINEECIVCQNR
ncbi:ThiF family adenylyltransferase [Serratia symbiotica]|uniref:HesA/MoeB/ThiF family protein n=1 Tax=Serratia symbiotica TaxID=138074 RepID=UPI00136F86F7|nr:ThiF family adenylyltransferase [Serratia symbiotica]MBF1995259.1 ThiF family adenylyltransferase [Serratia symbiotica]QTP13670.1 ThiF family adenylyltransferase [Serratia symbiotica]